MNDTGLPLNLVSYLLFSLAGPIGLIPLFARVTHGAAASLQIRIALLAAVLGFMTFAIALFVGTNVMQSAGTSRSSLIVAAGLILLITALLNVFGAAKAPAASSDEPSLALALAPLAIPGMVSPTGVAIVIIFASYFPGTSDRLSILGVIAALMVANVASMMAAHWFMRVVGHAPLVVLGAVFGVLQVALGVQMIASGIGRA